MIKSGTYIEKISKKLAELKVEIEQSGFLGLTNIHKHCENFIRDLLNITYNQQLLNLNTETATVPGLDLGDRVSKIAYQVTSDKTSEKINDTLLKVIRYKHYQQYSSIKVFILGNKQTTYTITTDTGNHFNFDWQKDIQDFDNLLRDIQHMEHDRLKSILDFLEKELPSTIKVLHNEDQIAKTKKTSLIDVNESKVTSGMEYYVHWAVSITTRGSNFSTPEIFNAMQEITKYHFGKNYLYVFNSHYKRSVTAKEITYREDLKTAGAVNDYKEAALQITDNNIKFEFARYKDHEAFPVNLDTEVITLLSLIFMCKRLYRDSPLQLDISVDYTTNGRLYYHSNSMFYAVTLAMSNYTFNSGVLQFSQMLYDIENSSLIKIMQKIIHGFSTSESIYGEDKPFISIKEDEQMQKLDKLKEHFEVS